MRAGLPEQLSGAHQHLGFTLSLPLNTTRTDENVSDLSSLLDTRVHTAGRKHYRITAQGGVNNYSWILGHHKTLLR